MRKPKIKSSKLKTKNLFSSISSFYFWFLVFNFCFFGLLLAPYCCFAEIDNLQVTGAQDTPFNYYSIIEQRNFFRPKKDLPENASPQSDTESLFQEGSSTNNVQDLVLTGVIALNNSYKAIVERKNQTKGFYVSINDLVDDYTVKDIQPNKIILIRDGQEFELKIKQSQTTPANISGANSSNQTGVLEPNNSDEQNQIQNLNGIQKLRMGTREEK